ncbi:hypothetical protein [Paraburkholderia azotifigens]|uniref:Uncharacterized protein n=1 Tax=Paraburkholderia azotifigens TaxID=2057004 RepID=A0ABU9QXD6_9BURK|nr:hypothetical protein [Paraburkholderia azotifigens]
MKTKIRTSARVAILAMPETSASAVNGMYDMFMSAGRDWSLIVEGAPGIVPFAPRVGSRHGASFVAADNVRLTPDPTLDACATADVVCVRELTVPPGEGLEGRFTGEIDCLRPCYEDHGRAMLVNVESLPHPY